MKHNLDHLFHPESIAVVGASTDESKLGTHILKNLCVGGHNKRLYPVNPHAEPILNLKTYASVSDIPDSIDLAVIAVPAPFVAAVVKECVQKKVPFLVIITAGFKETGEAGAKMELELKQIIKGSKTRIVGVNCLGVLSPANKLNASFSATDTHGGNIAFMSQSGAFGSAILDWSNKTSIGFKYFVSLGNKTDMNELDFVDYWEYDPEVKVVAAYLEGIDDGYKLRKYAAEASLKKPILVIKPGRSNSAKDAISSHTGTLAGDYTMIKTALEQSGVLMIESMQDLFDLMKGFSWLPYEVPDRVAVVTNAGGPAVVTTDLLEDHHLEMAKFEDKTHDSLIANLPPASNTHNPIDVIGDALSGRYRTAIEAVMKDKNTDSVIVILTPQIMTEIEKTAETIVQLVNKYKKPLVAVFIGGKKVAAGIKILNEHHIPCYGFPDQAVKVLASLSKYMAYRNKHTKKKAAVKTIVSKKSLHLPDTVAGRQILDQTTIATIAEKYGINLPKTAYPRTLAEAIAEQNKWKTPAVMKLSSVNLLHKIDSKAVYLNLDSEEKITEAYEALSKLGQTVLSKEEMKAGKFIQMQQFITGGLETILGVKRDGALHKGQEYTGFGHLVLFGLGGIYTEIFKDTAARLSPLSRDLVEEMVDETRMSKMLHGFRGKKYDYEGVVDTIQKIDRLVQDYPQIKEMDINPLIVTEDKVYAVDLKVILSNE